MKVTIISHLAAFLLFLYQILLSTIGLQELCWNDIGNFNSKCYSGIILE